MSETTMLSTTNTAANPNSRYHATMENAKRTARRILANPLTMGGIIVVFCLFLVAIFAPLLSHYEPTVQDLTNAMRAPSSEHWFGTDEYGRDIYSRIIWGSRVTLYVVFLVTVIIGPVGLAVGVVSGYFGGIVDTIFMRITDIFISFPSLVLALAFVAALGPGLDHAIIAIALTAWPPIARLARAETMTLRNADYITAVRLTGASTPRIIIRHIIPMCLSSVIIRLTFNMAGIILTAAGLGFLGLGAQPPIPEWGAMISEGRRYMLECWWMVAFPGMAIMMVSLAFNLLGDGLRDALDPRGE